MYIHIFKEDQEGPQQVPGTPCLLPILAVCSLEVCTRKALGALARAVISPEPSSACPIIKPGFCSGLDAANSPAVQMQDWLSGNLRVVWPFLKLPPGASRLPARSQAHGRQGVGDDMGEDWTFAGTPKLASPKPLRLWAQKLARKNICGGLGTKGVANVTEGSHPPHPPNTKTAKLRQKGMTTRRCKAAKCTLKFFWSCCMLLSCLKAPGRHVPCRETSSAECGGV